jgi:2-polyprenyl-6-methoxyphenol hydroxylase-like FAD-dependent oxidoreductase
MAAEKSSVSKKARLDTYEHKLWLENLKVVVIGGGIGGLAAALALQRAGVRCRVFERDSSFSDRKQGYGLTLTNNPKGPLAELGLLEQCIRQDCPSNFHWLFQKEGGILGYYGRAFSEPSSSISSSIEFKGRGNLRIPRQSLRQMILDRLKPNTLTWGYSLKDFKENTDTNNVTLEFTNGEFVDADIVVGADGIRSVVRSLRDEKLKIHSCPLRYIGTAVILGLSSAEHPLITKGGFYMLDGYHRLFTMPFKEGGQEEGGGNDTSPPITMWQLSFSGLSDDQAKELRAKSPSELIVETLKRVEGTFAPIKMLIQNTSPAEVWATGLYDRDPMPSRSKEQSSRVCVIGDAAHPMSMFKGQGANQAIGDGPLLVSWLLKPGRTDSIAIQTRLRSFEREMIDRAGPKVIASRTAAERLHSPAAIQDEYGFEGVDSAADFKKLLQEKNIGAWLGGDLEQDVRKELLQK